MTYFINFYKDGTKTYYTDVWAAAASAIDHEDDNGDILAYDTTAKQIDGVIVDNNVFRN